MQSRTWASVVAGAWVSLMRLEEVEDREHEDPDEVDEVPEKAAYLDAVGHVLGILAIERFPEEEHSFKITTIRGLGYRLELES